MNYQQPGPPPYVNTNAGPRPYPRPARGRPQIAAEHSASPIDVMHPGVPTAIRTAPLIVWVRVADAAAMLGVSKMTVYRLIHAGELEATRVGRQFRLQEREVTRYIRENSTSG